MSSRGQLAAWVGGLFLTGLFVGNLFLHDRGAIWLAGVAGGILGWGAYRGAVWAALRGALVGAAFLVLVAPVMDWWISGIPIGENLKTPITVGGLVGALLGVRNFRPKKARSASEGT